MQWTDEQTNQNNHFKNSRELICFRDINYDSQPTHLSLFPWSSFPSPSPSGFLLQWDMVTHKSSSLDPFHHSHFPNLLLCDKTFPQAKWVFSVLSTCPDVEILVLARPPSPDRAILSRSWQSAGDQCKEDSPEHPEEPGGDLAQLDLRWSSCRGWDGTAAAAVAGWLKQGWGARTANQLWSARGFTGVSH